MVGTELGTEQQGSPSRPANPPWLNPAPRKNLKPQGLNMDTEKTPPPAVEPWHRSRMLLRNPVSLAGIALVIVSLANIFLFVIIDAIAIKPGPYVGILA